MKHKEYLLEYMLECRDKLKIYSKDKVERTSVSTELHLTFEDLDCIVKALNKLKKK